MNPPEFLAIGHLVKDLTKTGYRWGGTVYYAALAAAKLGVSAAILTRASTEVLEIAWPPSLALARLPSPFSTTFENRYEGGHRRQWLRVRAEAIRREDVPQAWHQAPLVLLGPVAQEFGAELGELFPQATVGLCLQGWLRAWDALGRVHPYPWHDEAGLLARISFAICSEEDLGGQETLLHEYRQQAPLFILTRGEQGATLYLGQRSWQVPAFPRPALDATGAGDVFAAAFLLRYGRGDPPLQAARYASCVASFAAEAEGAAGLPTPEAVAHRLQEATAPAVETQEAR